MEKKTSDITKRFQELIEALGETRYSFAKGLKVTYHVINNICNGRNQPSFMILNKIAVAYPNVNLVWFITGEGKMFTSVIDKKDSSLLFQKMSAIEDSISSLSAKFAEDEKSEEAAEVPVKKKRAQKSPKVKVSV